MYKVELELNSKADTAVAYHSTLADRSRVWCAAWHHKGALLASCGDDRTVKLWKFEEDDFKLELLSTLDGDHTRTIRRVTFSPSGRFIAAAGFDSLVTIYNRNGDDYEEYTTLECHSCEVKCCAFSQSEYYLATCSRDKSIWIWQMDEEDDFTVLNFIQNHSQDVKFVVWHPHEEMLASCGYDCSIQFHSYDGDDWSHEKIEAAHDDTVWCADFSADGTLLVSVGGDHNVALWKRQKSGILTSKYSWSKAAVVVVDTRWPLYSVSWNKVNGLIAFGGGDRMIRIFELEKSAESLSLIEAPVQEIFSAEIDCVSWNPDKPDILAVTGDDGTLRVLRVTL